jgi:predicted RNA-binding Zn ribbon-like protein
LVETRPPYRDLKIVGGNLALDFCNTVDGDPGGEAWVDHLAGYRGLVLWGAKVGLVEREGAERLLGREGSPVARAAVEQAHGLRDLLSGIFLAVAEGREPSEEDLEALAGAERESLSGAVLAGDLARGYGWRWPDEGVRAPLIGPVVHAAVELLGSGELTRLKTCTDCDWLFLDRSKNRSRKWCTMEICGTQAKMRRYVARRAARRAAPG